MKKTLLLAIIAFCCLQMATNLQAQDYVPFPMVDAIWTEQNEIYEPPQTWTSLYKTETDTFLLSNTYRNIYEYYIHPGTFDTIRELYASIRQDTNGKKVFIIRHYFSEKQERLLLDFDVNVSDTVVLSAYYWDLFPHATDSVYIVDSISEITLVNNKTTNVFYLSNFSSFYPVSQILIEGVGSVTNPFGPAYGTFNKELRKRDFCCPRFLLCLTIGENEQYVFNEAASCGKLSVWTSIDAFYSNTKISIYPNPAKDWAAFDYTLPENANNATLIITDAFGKTIAHFVLSGIQGQQLWDTRGIVAGTYIYIIKVNGSSKTGKIVINK